MPHPATRPGSVWDTGRHALRHQLARRHVAATRAGSVLTPAIARRIITSYTAPGDTVCDPQPGPGLVLAEAIRSGRHALGIQPGPDWVSAHDGNLDHARLSGPVGTVHLLTTLDDPCTATVDLVITGFALAPDEDPEQATARLRDTLTSVRWLRPDGHLVLTCRPHRHHGQLLDLPGLAHHTATSLGLECVDHCIALTAPVRDEHVRPRVVTRAGHQRDTAIDPHGRATTHPTHLDVVVFRPAWNPTSPASAIGSADSPSTTGARS